MRATKRSLSKKRIVQTSVLPAARFRKALLLRLIAITGLAAPVFTATGVGCGDGDNETGSEASASEASASEASASSTTFAGGDNEEVVCFGWPEPGCTNTSSSTQSSSAGGGMGGAGGSGAGGAGGMGGAEPAPPCPSAMEAGQCFAQGFNSISEAPDKPGECCYIVSFGVGRPFLVDGRALVAPLKRRAPGWSAALRPRVGDLCSEARRRLGGAWAADAQLEHASVASFSRLSLELLAFGAPAELIELSHRAALDEVRHSQLCFALASAYAGTELAPSALPMGPHVALARDLSALVASAVLEGCVGETLAAVQASEQRERASDPAVKRALSTIAEDEARHAELSWRIVAWAIQVGGAEVRRAAAEAFAEAFAAPRLVGAAAAGEAYPGEIAHGRLPEGELRAVLAAALRDVVGPAARALLGS
jgi:hypothetical protein